MRPKTTTIFKSSAHSKAHMHCLKNSHHQLELKMQTFSPWRVRAFPCACVGYKLLLYLKWIVRTAAYYRGNFVLLLQFQMVDLYLKVLWSFDRALEASGQHSSPGVWEPWKKVLFTWLFPSFCFSLQNRQTQYPLKHTNAHFYRTVIPVKFSW